MTTTIEADTPPLAEAADTHSPEAVESPPLETAAHPLVPEDTDPPIEPAAHPLMAEAADVPVVAAPIVTAPAKSAPAAPAEPWRRRALRAILYGSKVDRSVKARARVGLAILAFAVVYLIIAARLIGFGIVS